MKRERGVLIVDDNRTHREILAALLDQIGHHAYLAECGADALQLVRDIDFDLVITDLIMPKMNGINFALRVRELRPDLPVVLLTGCPDSVETVIHYGFIALFKPVSLERVTAVIEEQLQIGQHGRVSAAKEPAGEQHTGR